MKTIATNYPLRLIAVALFFMATAIVGYAQDTTTVKPRLAWSIDFNTMLHNREGGDEMRPDQTFFFTHVTPQVGITMGEHSVMGGATWFQPMNNELHGYKVVALAYYHYSGEHVDIKAGMAPALEQLPLYVRSDSINYLQPVTRGATFNYHSERSDLTAWIDWRQMQTATRREAFAAGFQYNYRYRSLRPNILLQYAHLAKTLDARDDEGVVDHLIITPRLDLDAGNFCTGLGALLSTDRDRMNENTWTVRAGMIAQIVYKWRCFRAEEMLYAGKEQMPYYDRYGNQLYRGDTWFQNRFYSRTDLVATLFQKPFVNVEAKLTFHASDKTTAFWQQVTARFYFDDKLWRNHDKSGKSNAPAFLFSRF